MEKERQAIGTTGRIETNDQENQGLIFSHFRYQQAGQVSPTLNSWSFQFKHKVSVEGKIPPSKSKS